MLKKLFVFVTVTSVALATLLYSSPTSIVYSQGEMEVQCGQILENEFTDNLQEHIYLLTMAPRESFDISVEPFGDFLSTVIAIYGPSGIRIGVTDNEDSLVWAGPKKSPAIDSGILSATGQYKIRVTNAPIEYPDKLADDWRYYGGIGLYTLSIGCSNRDGQKIKPGDIPQPTLTPAPTPAEQAGTQTSIVGEPASETLLPFLEIGQRYEIAFGSQTMTIKLIELKSDGWAKVEVDSRTGWLNINQVALIIPIN